VGLCSYLLIGGLVLLFFPQEGLRLLLSNGNYDEVFPRVAGMLLTGLGMTVLAMIRAHPKRFTRFGFILTGLI
jgi:hypothetical protein